jgi:hypothetical protein
MPAGWGGFGYPKQIEPVMTAPQRRLIEQRCRMLKTDPDTAVREFFGLSKDFEDLTLPEASNLIDELGDQLEEEKSRANNRQDSFWPDDDDVPF